MPPLCEGVSDSYARLVKIRTGTTAVVAALMLTGCSQTTAAERDTSAHAQLDTSLVQVLYPVDEYRMSPTDQAKVSRAKAYTMVDCMAARGFPVKVSDSELPMESRPYGLWNVDRAGKYGYDMPDETVDSADSGGVDNEPGGPRDQARAQCFGESQPQIAQFNPVGDPENPALADRIQSEARSAAEADPEWEVARQRWYDCIGAAGLSRHSNGESWLSQQGFDVLAQQSVPPTPAQKQEEIRIAVIEARYNESTSLTQTLADIEASYQTPLIRQNRSALLEEKRRNQEAVDRAAEYLLAKS